MLGGGSLYQSGRDEGSKINWIYFLKRYKRILWWIGCRVQEQRLAILIGRWRGSFQNIIGYLIYSVRDKASFLGQLKRNTRVLGAQEQGMEIGVWRLIEGRREKKHTLPNSWFIRSYAWPAGRRSTKFPRWPSCRVVMHSRLEVPQTWVKIQTLTLTSSVPSDKFINFSEPQPSFWQNRSKELLCRSL